LLCLAGFLWTATAGTRAFHRGGWRLLEAVALYFPMLLFALTAFALLLQAAAYPAGRLLVRGDATDRDEAPSPAGSGVVPRGLRPKLMVVSIGSSIGSALILGGSWAQGTSPAIPGAFWAGLATGVSGILGAWPAAFGRPVPLGPPPRSLFARLVGILRRRRKWKGWETVMEDPAFNWFDALTVAWLVIGLVALFLPFQLRQRGVAFPLALKFGWRQFVVTFVVQGILFVFARFFVRSAVTFGGQDLPAKTSAAEIWGRLGWRSAVPVYLAIACMIALVGFFLKLAEVPTLARVRDIAGPGQRAGSGALQKIHALAISPDGRLALTGQEDGTVRLWDLETGAETRRFTARPPNEPPAFWVYSVAFSPDGKLALAGAYDKILVWDIHSGREVRRVEGDHHVYCVSPDGRLLVTGSRAGRSSADAGVPWLVVRDLATGAVIRRFEGDADAAISRDGRRLLGGSRGDVCCWDLDTGRELYRWAIGDHIERVTFVPDGKQAVTIDFRGDVYFWDTDGGGMVRTLRGPAARTLSGTEPAYCRAAIFAEGRRAAILFSHVWFLGGDSLRLYDLEHRELVYAGDLPTATGNLVAGTSDGRRLLTTTPYRLHLWSLPRDDGK
jgi:hypothetical protein